MNFIKKYRFILAIVVPILILIIFRAYGSNHFKPDAGKWAAPSLTGTNLVSVENFSSLPGKKLIINLDNSRSSTFADGDSFNISPDSILLSTNIKMMKKNDGPVLLVSSESSSAAKIWMILSQMGVRNLYILGEPEVLKHEFRPDTIAGPGSVSF